MPIQRAGLVHTQHSSFDKEEKEKKHIVPVSENEFEHGDPDFVDERVPAHKLKEEKSFLSSLFEDDEEDEQKGV
ncbi:MAG: hypothetical protein ACI9TV_000347 [Sulfurimonas sp.]|jgi:hypothetical protein|uniref:hypothetical protein n=1 Tax=Sulfurimonas sp. TaxID=2022749 RepID=UPI0039E2CEDE